MIKENEKKKVKFNGALLVDKPIGLTSHDVVFKIRKHIGQKSVGHAGTLDPLASGVLVILLGEATKLSRLILNKNKSYELKLKLGLETDTWDTDGKVLSESSVSFDIEDVEQALNKVLKYEQYPLPIYSAVKVNGKKLYEYALNEIPVDVPTRPMSFFDVKNLQKLSPSEYAFAVSCFKGGYIRSLAHCLGKQLNTNATISSLRRTGSDPFSINQTHTLDSILNTDLSEIANLDGYKSLADLLISFKSLTVGGRDETLMKNGAVPNDLKRRLVFEQKRVNKSESETYIKIYGAENLDLISLLHLQPKQKMKVFRKFV